MYKLACKKCGCDREFKNERSLKKAIKLNRELCYKCNRGKSIDKVPMIDAIEFYRNESIRQGVPAHKLDTSSFPPNIPKDPWGTYREDGFQWSIVTNRNNVSVEVAIEFYRTELKRQNASSYSKLDKSSWPDDIPKHPMSSYKNFKWSDVTGFTMDREWVPVEVAIEFYKSEVKRQGVSSLNNLDKSNWSINIPKSPIDEYEGFQWSMITGNIKSTDASKAMRAEIARLIISYGDMIDNFDDTLIAMLLSQLVEKAKISKLVAGKVKKLIMNVVDNNEQGERKEKLELLAKDISESETYSEMFEISHDVESDVNVESDDVESDVESDNLVDDIDPIELSKEKIKSRSKAMSQAALNDDFTTDFKELMRKNALKYMWYLEFLD